MCEENLQFARIVNKTGKGIPTIPISNSVNNGDWLTTDIYEGEMYTDLNTKKVYTRVGAEIVDINSGGKSDNTGTLVIDDIAMGAGVHSTYIIAWNNMKIINLDPLNGGAVPALKVNDKNYLIGDLIYKKDIIIVTHAGAFVTNLKIEML